jgi:CRP-like cAMP-binding protein
MKRYERLFRKFGKRYTKGTYIFREGDTGSDMFYILSGRVRVEQEAGHTKNKLAELGPGGYFGEMAPLIDIPRTASVIALEDSNIAVVDRETFCHLLIESRGVSLLLLREFSHRLKRSNGVVEELTKSRLKLIVLVYLFKEWPFEAHVNPVEDLALHAGEDSAAIQEILNDLDQDGIITFIDGTVTQFNQEKVWTILGKIESSASEEGN